MGFSIGKAHVGGSHPVIIAEAGVNHLRRLDYAEELVSAAARAGAQIVKFQTYDAAQLTTRTAPRFWKWEGEHDADGSQFDSYAALATPDEDFTRALLEICEANEVEFMSTPFDLEAVRMLARIGSKGFKVASGDITNLPLLREVGVHGLPVFLSTGASDLGEVETAVAVLESSGCRDICIMHCTLTYPTRPEDANLTALMDLRAAFPSHVLGLSDHTVGSFLGAASVLLGVDAIEKHFTFDRSLPDSADHWLSADEAELRRLVELSSDARMARGIGRKSVLESEKATRANARRSLVASRAIRAGEKFDENNVTSKRPAAGISPMYFDELVGLTAAQDIAEDAVLVPSDVVEDASFVPIDTRTIQDFRRNG